MERILETNICTSPIQKKKNNCCRLYCSNSFYNNVLCYIYFVLSPCEAFDTIAAATFDEKNTTVDSENSSATGITNNGLKKQKKK